MSMDLNTTTLLSKCLKDFDKKLDLIEVNTRSFEGELRYVCRKDKGVISISLRICILKVEDINITKQQFTCEFYLSATWQEPNLNGKPVNDEVDWDQEWDPGIVFGNAVEIRSMRRKHKVFFTVSGEPPTVQLTYKVKGIFRSELNFRNFPFDYQVLYVTVTSHWSSAVVVFQQESALQSFVANVQDTTIGDEWQPKNHVICSVGSAVQSHWSTLSFSTCSFKFEVIRHYSHYTFNIAFLFFIITVSPLVSFALGTSEIAFGFRLVICFMILLALVVVKISISNSLPKVPYSTVMDKYFLSCLFFVFFVVTENAISSLLVSTKIGNIDLYLLLAAVGVLLALQFGFLALVISINRIKKEICYDTVINEIEAVGYLNKSRRLSDTGSLLEPSVKATRRKSETINGLASIPELQSIRSDYTEPRELKTEDELSSKNGKRVHFAVNSTTSEDTNLIRSASWIPATANGRKSKTSAEVVTVKEADDKKISF